MNNTGTNNMDINNDDEYVREPDQLRTERLINDSVYNPIIGNAMYDIDTVLEQSKHEYSQHREIEEQQEIEQILKQQQQEQIFQQNKFSITKRQLNKLSIFDRPNLYYYELALSIIEMYNNNYITEYKIKPQEHANLFHIIQLIRIPTTELEELTKLIITE